jgi:hypothetical protein
MDANIHLMQKIGGVNDDNMGRQTNAQSGEAIKARQSEGALQTPRHLRQQAPGVAARRPEVPLPGRAVHQRAARHPADGRPRHPRLGEGQPAGTTDATERCASNDITATQADFEVDDQDFHASMREALFEEMMTLVQKLPPEIGLKFLDLVVDLVDIPGKRALVDRIRKMTGMSSPEDEQNPSPEKKCGQEVTILNNHKAGLWVRRW